MREGAGDAGDADGVAADILTTGYAMKALNIGSGVEVITTPMSL